jgi:Tfp pilus assembly protein PilN
MLRLNLLREDFKKNLRNKRLGRLLLKTEITLLAMLLAMAAIFISAEKIISNNVQKLSREASLQIESNRKEYELKTKEINGQLAAASKIQQGFISYSPILKKISALIPEDTALSYLNIDLPGQKIKIRGSAASRDSLLSLEKNIQNAPFLSEAIIPLAAKLKKENIEFDLDLKINLENLRSESAN